MLAFLAQGVRNALGCQGTHVYVIVVVLLLWPVMLLIEAPSCDQQLVVDSDGRTLLFAPKTWLMPDCVYWSPHGGWERSHSSTMHATGMWFC